MTLVESNKTNAAGIPKNDADQCMRYELVILV